MFRLFSSKNDDSKVARLASEIEEIFSSLFPDEEVLFDEAGSINSYAYVLHSQSVSSFTFL